MDKFEELTIPHVGTLYRMAFHLTGARADAEDLVQDVYFKARKSFHTLRNHGKCKSWLCSILYRRFVDEYRRQKKFIITELENIPAMDGSDDNEWPDSFRTEDISKALEKLNPLYRAPLVAHFLSGLSYSEIAKSLDIPIGTVMSRLYHARKHLAKALQGDL